MCNASLFPVGFVLNHFDITNLDIQIFYSLSFSTPYFDLNVDDSLKNQQPGEKDDSLKKPITMREGFAI